MPCCDFFLYLPKSLWKSSCEACTLTLTDDSHLLLYLTSWVLMLIVHTIFFICCITLREARSTLCMQVQWLPALEEQWILLLLLAGEQSWQLRSFCSLPASPPRVPLRAHDWLAKAFSALSFHRMLETAHKATHLSTFGNKHAGEAYPVCRMCCSLQHWNDGTWDKEAMVRKRDRPSPNSYHEESISFPLSKALKRLK